MNDADNNFAARMDGRFHGLLQWTDLDALWEKVRTTPEGWYASLIGEVPAKEPLSADALNKLVCELDTLLRHEHDYDYCGIVYVDDPSNPAFIKIYDPHNLGTLCGSSGVRIPPRWVLSRIQPTLIVDDAPLPNGRRRWWQRLLGQTS
jgi:hypothetical protein